MSRTTGNNEVYADYIGSFINSDYWRIVKYRYNIYKQSLGNQLYAKVRSSDTSGAQQVLGKIDAINEMIEITERLSQEIKQGKLDGDVALASLKITRE